MEVEVLDFTYLLLLPIPEDKSKLTTENRMKELKKWFVDEEWLDDKQFYHPTVMKMLTMWEQWWRVPENDNKLYDEFKKAFLEMWHVSSWNSLLYYTYFLHPTYYVNEHQIFTNEREA